MIRTARVGWACAALLLLAVSCGDDKNYDYGDGAAGAATSGGQAGRGVVSGGAAGGPQDQSSGGMNNPAVAGAGSPASVAAGTAGIGGTGGAPWVPVGETAGYAAIAGRSAVAPSALGGASGAGGSSVFAGGASVGAAGGNGEHKSSAVAGAGSVGGVPVVVGSTAIAGRAATAGTTSSGTNAGGSITSGGSSPGEAGTSIGGATIGGSSATATGGSAAGGSSASGGSSPASGGSAMGGSGAGGSSAVEAPRVLGVTPADGSTGVDANTKLEVTFSKKMDTASVASAISITDLTLSNLTLTWSSDNTVLSIKANDGFAYASGTTTTFASKTFNLLVNTAAKDSTGNSLASAYSSNFKTLRRVSQTITPHVYYGNTYSKISPDSSCPEGKYRIGGFTAGYNPVEGEYILFVTFNTDGMVAPRAVEQAVLRATQGASDLEFYSSGGWVELVKIEYQTIDDTVYNASVVRGEGKFSTSASDTSPALSFLQDFAADLAASKRNQLYRLVPYSAGHSSKYAYFDCQSFAIDTTYLTP